MSLKTYMSERQPISRWRIMNVFLAGIMCGAVLGIIIGLGAVVM